MAKKKEKEKMQFMAHVGFKFNYEQKEALKKSAKKDGRSLSNLLVKLCTDHLKETEK